MSKVYSRFDLPEKKTTNSGNTERELFKWTKDEYGIEHLETDGTEDIQSKIESYADECDIKNIVARAAFDPVFAQELARGTADGTETDITEYPENIHELKKMADEAGKTIDEIYNQLEQAKAEQAKPEKAKPEKAKEEAKTNEPE